MGGSAYNIVTLDYDRNKEGERLRQMDADAKVRAMMRSKNLDQKNNCGFNVLTGEQRNSVQVPFHERYNPIQSAASNVIMGSSHSQRGAGSSHQSQRSALQGGLW